MRYILTLGEMLVDVIPTTQVRLGETCYAPHPGGAIANVAVAIARLGGLSRFIGGVSEDEFGQLLMGVLAANCVDTQYVHVIQEAPTAIVLVMLQADGQRHFTFFRQGTADTQLRAESLNWNAWQGVAVCHVGGVLLSSEPARSATFAAMEHTRQIGSLVSFDANIRPMLWASQADIRETIAEAIKYADIVKLSADEAEFVGEKSRLAAELTERERMYGLGEALLERGPRLVIITSGAHGALLLTARHRVGVPTLPVRPVDTTGAGDAFIGAVLYKLAQQEWRTPLDLQALSEQSLRELGSFANLVAGLSVTRYGGISSFPFMQEVSSFAALGQELPEPSDETKR